MIITPIEAVDIVLVAGFSLMCFAAIVASVLCLFDNIFGGYE